MTYEETISYLFNSTPLFQNVGKDAYKEGLDNTHVLDAHFNHPHKKFKTILLYSLQQYNDTYGASAEYMTQNIIVADMLYKWTSTFSTKLELQYLQTKQDKKDWMAALLEVNFAPHWSIFASDMYNHGSTKVHYYNAGVSYNKSRTRVALGYGRYKQGFICSGGVCRTIPAYTGANLTITTSF